MCLWWRLRESRRRDGECDDGRGWNRSLPVRRNRISGSAISLASQRTAVTCCRRPSEASLRSQDDRLGISVGHSLFVHDFYCMFYVSVLLSHTRTYTVSHYPAFGKVKFYLTPQGYSNQTWKYSIAVWHQTGWLKKGNILVKYSIAKQFTREWMNSNTIQHNYIHKWKRKKKPQRGNEEIIKLN